MPVVHIPMVFAYILPCFLHVPEIIVQTHQQLNLYECNNKQSQTVKAPSILDVCDLF